MMGEIGIPELLIMLAVAIVVFGPSRIAGVGRSLGQAIRSLRSEARDEGEPSPAADEKRV